MTNKDRDKNKVDSLTDHVPFLAVVKRGNAFANPKHRTPVGKKWPWAI